MADIKPVHVDVDDPRNIQRFLETALAKTRTSVDTAKLSDSYSKTNTPISNFAVPPTPSTPSPSLPHSPSSSSANATQQHLLEHESILAALSALSKPDNMHRHLPAGNPHLAPLSESRHAPKHQANLGRGRGNSTSNSSECGHDEEAHKDMWHHSKAKSSELKPHDQTLRDESFSRMLRTINQASPSTGATDLNASRWAVPQPVPKLGVGALVSSAASSNPFASHTESAVEKPTASLHKENVKPWKPDVLPADPQAMEDIKPSAVSQEKDNTSSSAANTPWVASNTRWVPPHLRASKTATKSELEDPTTQFSSVVHPSKTTSIEFAAASKPATIATPSSVDFGVVSPSTAATKRGVEEDLNKDLYFDKWAKPEQRDGPAAKIRKVIIKNLHTNSSPDFVTSLIYGGPLEQISIGTSMASVLFVNADDCLNYYNSTSNDIVYKTSVFFVELGQDVDVIGGLLKGMLEAGATRCVRAIGVEKEWTIAALLKEAERKGRKVEKIVDTKTVGGDRMMTVRFLSVQDAVQFKATLSRSEAWEHCNINFAQDPCALATDIHFGD